MSGRRLRVIALLAVSLPVGPLFAEEALRSRAVLEEELKAEFIERFTRFVEWPSDALGPQTTRFVLCVAGRGPTAEYLASLAGTRAFKGRPLQVRRLGVGDSEEACHLLFIAGSEEARLGRIKDRTTGRPILTVGDTPGYAERGVLINLYMAGGRLRFEINMPAVAESRLTFSSQLLRLGRLVGQDQAADQAGAPRGRR